MRSSFDVFRIFLYQHSRMPPRNTNNFLFLFRKFVARVMFSLRIFSSFQYIFPQNIIRFTRTGLFRFSNFSRIPKKNIIVFFSDSPKEYFPNNWRLFIVIDKNTRFKYNLERSNFDIRWTYERDIFLFFFSKNISFHYRVSRV